MSRLQLPKFMRLPTHPYQKEANRFPLLPAIVVFVTLLGLIALSWRAATRAVEDDMRSTVSERSLAIESSIQGRLTSYRDVLYAAASFVNTSGDSLTREQWNSFINYADVSKRYPGILSVGYAQYVAQDQLDAYQASVRATSVPSFAYEPPQPNGLAVAVIFQEPPPDNVSALGFNMLSEQQRKAAVEQARDTAEPTITRPLTLNRDVDNPQPGIVMCMPVYRNGAPTDTVAERRAAFQGVTFIPFRTQDLIGNAVQFADTHLGYIVSVDGIELHQRFPGENSTKKELVTTNRLAVYGQNWDIQYFADDLIVTQTIRERPNGVLIGGFLFASSIAISVYLLVRRRILDQAYMEQQKLQTAKDDLLSLASHQLRTPATGVKQYLGMVLQGFAGDIDEEQRKFLSLAYESNDRQLRIINEFLYMAKADAGRIIVTPKDFDFSGLVREVIDEQAEEAESAGHSIVVKVPKNLVVHGDDHSIRMIVENLISNAIKYTNRGGKITVTATREGKKVLLHVKDTGVGISEADQALLFRQFSRIPNELTQNTSGSGIGLYLSKHLAELNKGDVYLSASHPQRGSTFTALFRTKTVKNITDIAKRPRG